MYRFYQPMSSIITKECWIFQINRALTLQWAQYCIISKRRIVVFWLCGDCSWLVNSFSADNGRKCTLNEKMGEEHTVLAWCFLSLRPQDIFFLFTSISDTFLYLLFWFLSLFFSPVLQSTFPEQPQEPSYIKLQHKDDVRIMNPHLHRHLYSDLPGYKLGRSSGILSRGFHGKLRFLQLPSRFFLFMSVCLCACVCVCVHLCVHVYICACMCISVAAGILSWLHDFWEPRWPSFSYGIWCWFEAKWSRDLPAVSMLAEDILWYINKIWTPVFRDHAKKFFKQIDKHYCLRKQIICTRWRFDFTAGRVQRTNCEIALSVSVA